MARTLTRADRPDIAPPAGCATRPVPRGRAGRRAHHACSRGGAPRWARSGSGGRVARCPGLTTKSISAIRPSCDAAGQQPAVWFEIRLPSPNTTGLPCTRRIGCTTCTCWPTIASIAGERVSRRASARCCGLDRRDELGAPVDVHDHDARAVAPGPARVAQDRPGRRPVHAPRVRHGLAVRDGRVGEERDPHALHAEHRDPPARAGRSARCRWPSRPARRSAWRVESIPDWPASSEWFDAVLHASQPTRLTERARSGRRVEHRVALHRPGHERRLHVAEREVGAARSRRRTGANSGAKS